MLFLNKVCLTVALTYFVFSLKSMMGSLVASPSPAEQWAKMRHEWY
jgi:hypothetical protein